jgi:hypothetical protein
MDKFRNGWHSQSENSLLILGVYALATKKHFKVLEKFQRKKSVRTSSHSMCARQVTF